MVICNAKVILDNAAYQRCYWVRSFAGLIGIEFIFLPSDSPNLNLVERYWKSLMKKCLYNQFYGDFQSFCKAIDSPSTSFKNREDGQNRQNVANRTG